MKNMAAQLAAHRAKVQETLNLNDEIQRENDRLARLRFLETPAGQYAEQRRIEQAQRDAALAAQNARIAKFKKLHDEMWEQGVIVGTRLKITEPMKPFIHRLSDRKCYKLCLTGNPMQHSEPWWTLSNEPRLFGLVVYYGEAVYDGDLLVVTQKGKKSLEVMRYNPEIGCPL